MLTTLFLIGLWLVLGFYAARGTYYSFIEFASVGGPVWTLTTLVFLTGPLGLIVAALSDKDALVRGFKNEPSPNPQRKSYVEYFGRIDQFNDDLRQWNLLRSLLLIPEWQTVEVEPDPFADLYQF